MFDKVFPDSGGADGVLGRCPSGPGAWLRWGRHGCLGKRQAQDPRGLHLLPMLAQIIPEGPISFSHQPVLQPSPEIGSPGENNAYPDGLISPWKKAAQGGWRCGRQHGARTPSPHTVPRGQGSRCTAETATRPTARSYGSQACCLLPILGTGAKGRTLCSEDKPFCPPWGSPIFPTPHWLAASQLGNLRPVEWTPRISTLNAYGAEEKTQ